MPTATEFALRVLIGGLLGSLIGFERQWRQRGAGVHTSALVAIGAALFTLLGPVIGSDSETRILANIVTGVGFLAGGVILRQGASISGLNTAATIWATAAVGALAGVGQFSHAFIGAAAIVAFNLALQPLVEKIDSQAAVYQERHGEKTYRIHAACDDAAVDDVRAAVVDAVKASDLILHSLSTGSTEEGQEVKVELRLARRDDPVVERFSKELAQHAAVRNVRWRMLDS
ncbi:MAG: MgtC/SapB family protein [Candidatus Eremiobacteraeota bacterium]|nr:MgtC/SapB family protein [Candidatus Eremiobacteraeota bacterium]MBV8498464.1 MgtC/SapB family protein [Candidatus Eremiobacteraeota bacterium]